MKHSLHIFILSLLCWSPTDVFGETDSPPWNVPQLMELMAQVTSRQESFTETKIVGVLTRPLVLKGTLSYVRPDRVEKHVLAPYDEHVVVHGDQLTLANREGTKRVNVRSHPLIWSFVEAIRASLAGDLTTLGRFYYIDLQGTRDSWILILRPLDRQAAEYLSSVRLSGHGNRLVSVEIQETGGDRSVMLIQGHVS